MKYENNKQRERRMQCALFLFSNLKQLKISQVFKKYNKTITSNLAQLLV